MPVGISNVTSVAMDNLTYIANSTTAPEFMVRVNYIIYEGWLFFILLLVLWAILIIIAQLNKQQFFVNLMRTGAVVSVMALIARFITGDVYGVTYGLVTDYQLWIFPLVTIVTATILYATRKD